MQHAERYRDPSRDKLLSYRFAYDPGLAVLNYKIWALSFLGFPDQAAQISARVLAELPGHTYALTVATCTILAVTWPEFLFGELEACERIAPSLSPIAWKKGRDCAPTERGPLCLRSRDEGSVKGKYLGRARRDRRPAPLGRLASPSSR